MKKPISLIDYVQNYGRKAVSEKTGIKVSTIEKWLYTTKVPSPQFVLVMIRHSDGELTWDSVYGGLEARIDG